MQGTPKVLRAVCESEVKNEELKYASKYTPFFKAILERN